MGRGECSGPGHPGHVGRARPYPLAFCGPDSCSLALSDARGQSFPRGRCNAFGRSPTAPASRPPACTPGSYTAGVLTADPRVPLHGPLRVESIQGRRDGQLSTLPVDGRGTYHTDTDDTTWLRAFSLNPGGVWGVPGPPLMSRPLALQPVLRMFPHPGPAAQPPLPGHPGRRGSSHLVLQPPKTELRPESLSGQDLSKGQV